MDLTDQNKKRRPGIFWAACFCAFAELNGQRGRPSHGRGGRLAAGDFVRTFFAFCVFGVPYWGDGYHCGGLPLRRVIVVANTQLGRFSRRDFNFATQEGVREGPHGAFAFSQRLLPPRRPQNTWGIDTRDRAVSRPEFGFGMCKFLRQPHRFFFVRKGRGATRPNEWRAART